MRRIVSGSRYVCVRDIVCVREIVPAYVRSIYLCERDHMSQEDCRSM